MKDKMIEGIGYNYLNLPNAFTINGNANKLLYTYRADGTKLRKLIHLTKEDGIFLATTEYLDGFHYLTTVEASSSAANPLEFAYEQEVFIEEMKLSPTPELQFFPTAEGFYDFENNKYIYQYKDHF